MTLGNSDGNLFERWVAGNKQSGSPFLVLQSEAIIHIEISLREAMDSLIYKSPKHMSFHGYATFSRSLSCLSLFLLRRFLALSLSASGVT